LALESELRKDTETDIASKDSQLLGGASAPDMLFRVSNSPEAEVEAERKMYANIYLRPQSQFKYEPNLLGDYAPLMKQMDGQLNSVADSYVLCTIESRRPPAKLADTTGDGYSLLANTFGLHERSRKLQKKDGKKQRFDQEVAAY